MFMRKNEYLIVYITSNRIKLSPSSIKSHRGPYTNT